jgi:SRSO17 transposase
VSVKQRYEVRREGLLAECQVDAEVFRGMMGRLRCFAEPYVARLWRREQKEHCGTYLTGLLSDLDRKNAESIAYRHDEDRQGLQNFLGFSPWDHEPLLEQLNREVGEELGEPDGVIVFDPSGFAKKGKHSVGVSRQWLGRLGKIDNGQVGVYMGYVSRAGRALTDVRLFLPKEWCQDRKRRKSCGVPKGTRYRTRQELALEMLQTRRAMLPHAWVAGDDEMGRSTAFRRGLRGLQERYLLAVPGNTLIRDLQGRKPAYCGRGCRPKRRFERVNDWQASLSATRWTRIDVRDGEKGPLVVDIAKTRVVARTENSRHQATEELLVVIRWTDEDGNPKVDFYLSNAPEETSLEEMARVANAEHRIEECIKRSKSEAGLADYEVRTWIGWHHHQTLALIATWFLVREARRGKKMDPGNHSSADPGRPGDALAQGVSMRGTRACCA